MSGLPEGWSNLTLAEVVMSNAPIIYGILQPGPDVEGGVPYIRPTEIQCGRIVLSELRRTTSEIAERYRRSTLATGDLILSIVGTIGKIAVVPPDLAGANITQSSCRIRPDQRICKRDWLKYFLVSPLAVKLYVENRLGTAVPRLNLEDVRQFLLPLPPLAEQQRLVAKLDALSEKSACARTELARIATLVSRYKQAALNKAFSGELTREWQVVSLDLLSETVFDGPFGSNLKSADYTPDGPRVVRLENIGTREFIEEKRTHISEGKFRSLARHTLQANDLLFSSFVSEEIRACLFPSNASFRAINKADCFCIRLDKTKIDPKFALLQLTTEATYRHFVQQVHGATRPRINLSQLKHYPLVVPPLDEQHEIVRRIESAFAKIDRLAKEANRATELLGRLDEAILTKAFRGKLVPQDPNDEPASALIERVGALPTGVIERGQDRPAKKAKSYVRAGGGMTATSSPLVEVADAMTAQQKESSMSKTRQDPDVMGQPYLSKILRNQSGAGTVDALFKAADLPVADFYKQLAWEIENQLIRDKQDRLEAA